MMVMTAKVDFKKIMLGLAAAAVLILALILLLGGNDTAQTAAPAPLGQRRPGTVSAGFRLGCDHIPHRVRTGPDSGAAQ